MSKVVFTHSYFYRFDPKQWRTKQPYPPLATIQAAAVIRQAGFPVLLFDTNLKKSPDEIGAVLNREKPAFLVIYDDGFNYLTKMCLTNMRRAAFQMAATGRQNDCTVIINSSDATDQYEAYLNNGVDYVVRGEGEETLKELLIALQAENAVTSIEGLAFRQAGQTILTPSRPVLRHLDTLPLPAWDLVDIQSYKKIWLKKHGYFSLNIATTRGCPFKCNWCAKPIYGNRYNSRSPIQVVEEIDFLIRHYQPDHFWMCDDIFGLRPGWIQEFRNLVQQRSLRFKYKVQSRVDLLLQEDAIDALAQSGAETVWVGAESGSQKILDAMDKGTTLNQIEVATSNLRKKGISVAFFLQFGYPGETQHDIDATIQMVLKLMPDEIGISVSYPLPGTKFYEKVKDQLKVKRNWTDSNDLEMMFEGTYPPSFYRILHRYVHNRYRIQRGRQAVKFFSKQQASFRYLASMLYNLPLAWLHAYQLQKIHHAHARS